MIVVFDASTIVGAALKRISTPMRALQVAREHATIALSTAVYDEISEVLGQPKFAEALLPDRRQEVLEFLAAAATWVEPELSIADCVDPADNKYLELAAACGASIVVSSDRHLLRLHPWRGVAILNPADYLARSSP